MEKVTEMTKGKKPGWEQTKFFLTLNFTVACYRQVMGGISPPSTGIVGENRSTQSKTTVIRPSRLIRPWTLLLEL